MSAPNETIPRFGSMIGGAEDGTGEPFPLINPYTETAWAEALSADMHQVDMAVTTAADAQDVWRATPIGRRGELMWQLGDAILDQQRRLATLEARDTGKPITQCLAQMHFASRVLRYFAGVADKMLGRVAPVESDDQFHSWWPEPHGVCLMIIPWNSPVQITASKVGAALAAGNTVVVKPSSQASASVVEFARIAADVGVPPGVLNVVVGGASVGERLARNRDVAMVSFTGGVDAGKRVAHIGADRIVPVMLELGGKSANIVFSDADLPRAVAAIARGAFEAAGQSCQAASRLLVERPVMDEVVDAVVGIAKGLEMGDPISESTELGPLISAGHRASVRKLVEDAVASGATAIVGGGRVPIERGFFMQPTVLADVPAHAACATQEVFGPVLAVSPFDSEDEAVAMANDTEYGMAGGVWSADVGRCLRVAKSLRVGTVWVNTYKAAAAAAPFGGIGQSGYGRERGLAALREYSRLKSVLIEHGAR